LGSGLGPGLGIRVWALRLGLGWIRVMVWAKVRVMDRVKAKVRVSRVIGLGLVPIHMCHKRDIYVILMCRCP
jgi:hypothetical protein